MDEKVNKMFSKLINLAMIMFMIQIVTSIWIILRIFVYDVPNSFFDFSKSNLISYIIQVIIQGIIMLFLLNLEKKNPKVWIAFLIFLVANYLGSIRFIPNIEQTENTFIGLQFYTMDGIQLTLSFILLIKQIRYSNQTRARKQSF